jgi:16S rRNA (cytosine1402-N4)-methyltransferase
LDGILMDLGISSPQVDKAERGFSFKLDAPLDMRMNQTKGITAAEIVNSYEEKDLVYILKNFGEEKFAKKIAGAIIFHRDEKGPINSTLELAKLIKSSGIRYEPGKDPATRTFQALRIAVNKEIEEIEKVLPEAFNYLNNKGRLVVISFHSLEDRVVKKYIFSKIKTDTIPKYIPLKASEIKTSPLRIIEKILVPDQTEVSRNPRSRSAKLRIVEKIGGLDEA